MEITSPAHMFHLLTCILQIKVRRVVVVVGMTEVQTEQIVIGGERSRAQQTAVSLAPSFERKFLSVKLSIFSYQSVLIYIYSSFEYPQHMFWLRNKKTYVLVSVTQ